jgi:hypothetical protein
LAVENHGLGHNKGGGRVNMARGPCALVAPLFVGFSNQIIHKMPFALSLSKGRLSYPKPIELGRGDETRAVLRQAQHKRRVGVGAALARTLLPSLPSHATLPIMTVAPTDTDLARFLRDELGVDSATAADGAPTAWHVTAPLWLWRGTRADGTPTPAAWYFITIAGDVADAIRGASRGRVGSRGGFGSVCVTATIGATSWQTSVFPSKDAGGYLLPVKATVRKAEKLIDGSMATVTLIRA